MGKVWHFSVFQPLASLYTAGPECGYTGPILYHDLGLMPHSLVWSIPPNQRKAQLTFDRLMQLDADHLFITFDKQHSIHENEERAILKTPTWKNLEAVKTNCVYEVDFLTWMNYGILSHSKKLMMSWMYLAKKEAHFSFLFKCLGQTLYCK